MKDIVVNLNLSLKLKDILPQQSLFGWYSSEYADGESYFKENSVELNPSDKEFICSAFTSQELNSYFPSGFAIAKMGNRTALLKLGEEWEIVEYGEEADLKAATILLAFIGEL